MLTRRRSGIRAHCCITQRVYHRQDPLAVRTMNRDDTKMYRDVSRPATSLLRFAAFGATLGLALPACASAPLEVTKALAREAQAFCMQPTQYGMRKERSGEISGEVNISGFLRGLIKPSLAAKAKYEKDSYQGVLRSQLARALSDTNSCRLRAFHALSAFYEANKPKYLPSGRKIERTSPKPGSKRRVALKPAPGRIESNKTSQTTSSQLRSQPQPQPQVNSFNQRGGVTANSVGNVTISPSQSENR